MPAIHARMRTRCKRLVRKALARAGSAEAAGSLPRNRPGKGTEMRKLFRRRPSPAMVVACLALLVALGGTSIAAVNQLVPRNSVGTVQLRNAAVTNPKLRNNAVTSAKVANRSLLRSDFAPGQLPAGPTGPQGPAGPAGAPGPAGPRGTIGTVMVREQTMPINGQATGEVQALCASGELAISGGRQLERQRSRTPALRRPSGSGDEHDESGDRVPRLRSQRRSRYPGGGKHVQGIRPLLHALS